MRLRVGMAMLLAVAACAPKQEPGLVAIVSVPTNSESACLQLEIGSSGTKRLSPPVVLAGKETVYVGVAQGAFPASVELRALGFTDPGCQTRSREESGIATGTFGIAPIPEIRLALAKVTPKNETNCTDGLDEDNDRAIDCGDSDCDAQPCTSSMICIDGARCSNGTCSGGQQKVCATPPSACFASVGTCLPTNGSCSYAVIQGSCNDQDLCTSQDRCLDDGGCAGFPVVCSQSSNVCLQSAGTCADGGCSFSPKNDAGCDDSDSCTVGDRCDNGSCSGARVTCQATSCQSFANRCDLDGGCVFDLLDAGTQCDGGVCSIAGDCLPRFPYQPVNFDVVQLRAPPAAPTVLDCGETVIDTTGTGIPRPTNWCRNQPFEASIIRQAGGLDALLVSMSSLEITHDAGLRIIGDKPIIFGVFGDVSITGRVVSRAGTSNCTSGLGRDGTGAVGKSGGSGAGFSQVGGSGGDVSVTGPMGPAGGDLEANQSPSPLRPGCPGGRGGNAVAAASPGGGGLQISAGGVLSLNGVVAAPGRGGAGGRGGLTQSGGNGGGSGGLVILEARELVISGGAVTANGGGGGEGGALLGDGNPGNDGNEDSSMSANGGVDGVLLGGNGGNGGAASGPTQGETNGNGGGGGGSTGLVFLRGASTCSVGPTVALSPRPDGGCP